MNFIQRFLRAWRETNATATYDMMGDAPDGWTPEDGRALLTFLSSQTGQRLSVKLRNFVVTSAVNATRQPGNTEYHCGVAFGVNLSVTALQNFAALPRNGENIEEQSSSRIADLGIN